MYWSKKAWRLLIGVRQAHIVPMVTFFKSQPSGLSTILAGQWMDETQMAWKWHNQGYFCQMTEKVICNWFIIKPSE